MREERGMGETLVYDGSDPPVPGTACVACRGDGHFCPAKGWIGETAVCLACGEARPCARALAVMRLAPGLDGPKLPAASGREERRCPDCRGLLSEQTLGPQCWPCKKRAASAARSSAAAVAEAAWMLARGGAI